MIGSGELASTLVPFARMLRVQIAPLGKGET